jgi:hypothetical protein
MGPGAFKRLRGPVSILETIWMFSDFWSPRPALGLRALGGVISRLTKASHQLTQLSPIGALIPNSSGSFKLTRWSHSSSKETVPASSFARHLGEREKYARGRTPCQIRDAEIANSSRRPAINVPTRGSRSAPHLGSQIGCASSKYRQ